MTPHTSPTPRAVLAALLIVAASLAGGACGSSSDTSSTTTTAATSTTSEPAATKTKKPGTPSDAERLYGKRYCEVFLVTQLDPARADVYNSYPLNDCPDEQWSALDAKVIAANNGVPLAVLNGPRYWLMDGVEKVDGEVAAQSKTFGGIEMIRRATVDIGSLADAAKPYSIHEVNRSTIFTFDAGRTVYELRAPDGAVYVMQTYSQQKDATLTEADLAGLATRLQPPAGWTYEARTLTAPLRVVTTATSAQVLQDDLGNSYSLETGE